MARHEGLPRAARLILSKRALLKALVAVDGDRGSSDRVLKMETDFRERIAAHLESLPTSEAEFAKFNTNPFVVMFHAFMKEYRSISQIEADILPAKLFSSMETSAGRMVETVVLPVYSWQAVASAMHTTNSVIDGKKKAGRTLCLATLKSGPRCLNDEMSENIAESVVANSTTWASEAKLKRIDFTYGVLYGTKMQSNKKDWHILRKIAERIPVGDLKVHPGRDGAVSSRRMASRSSSPSASASNYGGTSPGAPRPSWRCASR